MAPFGIGGKKKRKNRAPAVYTKKWTLDAELEKTLIRQARRDPEWALKVAKTKYKIADSEVEPDPVELAKKEVLADALKNDSDFQAAVKSEYLALMNPTPERTKEDELNDRIVDAEIQALEANPELLKKAAADRLAIRLELNTSDPYTAFKKQLKAVRDIQDELGGEEGASKDGFLKNVLSDPKVIIAGIGLLSSMMGKPLPQLTSPEETYVIITDEGPIKMTKDEYEKYLVGHKKVKEIEPPKPEPTQEESVAIIPEKSMAQLKISAWLPYVDGKPEDFVSFLVESAERGDEDATLALILFKAKSADEVFALLAPHRNRQDDVGKTIRQLETKKEWLIEVIKAASDYEAKSKETVS